MIAGAALFERLVPDPPAWPGEPESAHRARCDARAWLIDNGLPTNRDEAWHYTPLDQILSTSYAPAAASIEPVDASEVDDLAGVHGPVRVVCVNGAFSAALSTTELAPAGVQCTDLASAGMEAPSHTTRPDGFRALNAVASQNGAAIVVAADVDVVEPIHVVHVTLPGAEPTASHPHTRIEAGAGSRLSVIETYVGRPGVALTNAATTIVAGPYAHVAVHRVQAEAAGTVHVGHTAITQAAGSEMRLSSVMMGADIARSAIDVVLDGRDARIDLQGLYLAAGTQRHDNVVTVEHAASGCSSIQLFKGVVDDHARGSFSGHVIVRPGTTATDAHQTSRSLVLTPTAQADSRPWLEILADDVKCTHGATVGRLGDEAMFYLRTRGIPAAEARAMLIGAFIGEIVEAIDPLTLRAHLEAAVATKLGSEGEA